MSVLARSSLLILSSRSSFTPLSPSSLSSFSSFSSSSPSSSLVDYEIEEDRVKIEKKNDGKVAVVSLNRPDKMNALDMAMFRSVAAAAQIVQKDKSIRAVVLRGEGEKAFCSGLDVKSVASNPLNFGPLLKKPSGSAISNLAQDVGYLWKMLPVPVVCAVDGVCFGGGLQIALGADMRVASSGSKFSIMEAKWGLIPDMSISVTLRELVRADIARELTYTGRIISAQEAKEYGLITHVTEEGETGDDRAMKIALEIAEKNPDAVCYAKQLLRESYSYGEGSGEEGGADHRLLDLETELQKKLLVGWNQKAKAAENFGVKLPFTERKGE